MKARLALGCIAVGSGLFGLFVYGCGGDDATAIGPSPEAGAKVDTGNPDPGTSDDDADTIPPIDSGSPRDAASDAIADAALDAPDDADASQVAKKKRVFVTKTKYSGDLKTAGAGTDGLDGADKICNSTATTAGLGGTWKAWLSTSTVNAVDRIADVAPWHAVDDAKTLLFATKAQLALKPNVAITTNETHTSLFSGSIGTPQPVWTGTKNTGVKDPSTCADWTIGLGAAAGEQGDYYSAEQWTRLTANVTDGCNKTRPIYCFEQ